MKPFHFLLILPLVSLLVSCNDSETSSSSFDLGGGSSLTPETELMLDEAMAKLEKASSGLGREAPKYLGDYCFTLLDVVDGYRSKNPGGPSKVSMKSKFGTLINTYSPSKMKAQCVSGDSLDIDCLEKLAQQNLR